MKNVIDWVVDHVVSASWLRYALVLAVLSTAVAFMLTGCSHSNMNIKQSDMALKEVGFKYINFTGYAMTTCYINEKGVSFVGQVPAVKEGVMAPFAGTIMEGAVCCTPAGCRVVLQPKL